MTQRTTTLTLPTGREVEASLWSPKEDDEGDGLGIPLALFSSLADSGQWSTFAASISRDRLVYGFSDLPAYILLQSVWAIGEPAVLVTQGPAAGEAGLRIADIAKGTISALALVDYHLPDHEVDLTAQPTCPIAVIRGRQSQIADHTQAVAARDAIGSKCRLIELENCADRAAESCPSEFETAIRWLILENGENSD